MYQVEHWAGGRHWVSSQVQEETFTLAPVPDTPAIIFLVRARNEHGLSPPSPLSDPVYTQPDAAPELASAYSGRAKKKSELLKQISDKLVELEEVAVLGSKKVRLSWKVNRQVKHGLIASLIPPGQVAAEHQAAVQGYWLQVAEVGGGGGGGGARTVRVAGGGARSHLLAGLAPATQYSAYLVPHTAGSLARPSRLVLFTTKEDGKLQLGAGIVHHNPLTSSARPRALQRAAAAGQLELGGGELDPARGGGAARRPHGLQGGDLHWRQPGDQLHAGARGRVPHAQQHHRGRGLQRQARGLQQVNTRHPKSLNEGW